MCVEIVDAILAGSFAAWQSKTLSFSRCRVESKRGRIGSRVKHWQVLLAILVALSASTALADDFKTIHGKEYKNVTISRVEPDGIVLTSKSGISKVYFVELPKEVQERFHYNPEKAAAGQAAAVQQAEKNNYELSLRDVPGARGGSERILELTFYRDVPQPQVVDKMLRESLEHAVAADGTRDILAMAFLGEEVLTSTQYSGELVYRAAQRKIMTLEQSRGVKTTVTDAAGYSVEVSEEKSAGGRNGERKWLTISLIYPTPPPLEQAYTSMQSEIEKNVPRGMDINAYVKIGDKGVKTSQRQMDDPTGGYVFMNYDAPSKKLYRKNMLIKTIK